MAVGGTIDLLANVTELNTIEINKNVTLNLNGFTYTGLGCYGAIYATGGQVVINGPGKIVGTECTTGDECHCATAVWASGTAKVTINGGEFGNSVVGNDDHYDLIYAKEKATIEVLGGTFKAQTPAWSLNLKDADRATAKIVVKGGSFYNFDPANNTAEGPGTSFVADGYVVVKDGDFYKVQQPVVAPEGETATGETINNVAESVQGAVKDAVASGSTETKVVVGETKIEFNRPADMGTFAGAADITTQIVVEDVTGAVDATVVDAVKEKVEEQVGEIGEDVVVAAYVEIDIHVFADGEHVGQITELPEKIRVSIPLPAGVTAGAGKKYYVAHEHDGDVELLPATIEGGYVVFYSDTFSTYAVVTQTAPTSAGVALTDKVDMVATDAAQTKYPNVTVSVHKANTPKDTNKDGRFDVSGNVKYFMMNGQEYVQVNTVSEADYTVYVAGTKTLFGYFKAANPFYYGYGVPFNNFGDKCGQYDDEPVAGTKYYTFETNLYKAVKAGAEDFNLMVGNELVPVKRMSDEWVEHVAAYTYDKNYKVVGVKCAECGAPAALVPNFASLPKNIQKGVQGVDYFAIGDGQYYYWSAPVATQPTDKVESAETFDAGIAMYVGMSVMAAAGSAVVLKKRED